jgi:hypothetical protein
MLGKWRIDTASSCQGQQSKLTVCLIQAVSPCCSYAAYWLGMVTGWLCIKTGSVTREAYVSECEVLRMALLRAFSADTDAVCG